MSAATEASGLTAFELYDTLCRALETANLADSPEREDLPSKWGRHDNVFGHLRRAIEEIVPGAVAEWAENGEWPAQGYIVCAHRPGSNTVVTWDERTLDDVRAGLRHQKGRVLLRCFRKGDKAPAPHLGQTGWWGECFDVAFLVEDGRVLEVRRTPDCEV